MKTNNVSAYMTPEMEIVALSQEGVICYSFGDAGRPGAPLYDFNDGGEY